MNLSTGRAEKLSDLSDDGRIVFISDYAIVGETAYYCNSSGFQENMGFYSVKLDGGTSTPRQLISTLEMREDGSHPYTTGLYSVEVSPDGRWACLSVMDMRVRQRDIPFADDMSMPQPDPNAAVSVVTGLPWVPCHNTILFILEY